MGGRELIIGKDERVMQGRQGKHNKKREMRQPPTIENQLSQI